MADTPNVHDIHDPECERRYSSAVVAPCACADRLVVTVLTGHHGRERYEDILALHSALEHWLRTNVNLNPSLVAQMKMYEQIAKQPPKITCEMAEEMGIDISSWVDGKWTPEEKSE